MDFIIVVQKLDRKIFDLQQVFSAKFVKLTICSYISAISDDFG